MEIKGNNDSDTRIKSIAEKIKRLRIEKQYTSYETFALDYQLDRKQYWRIENGDNITLKTLLKILDIHQITLSQFFNEEFQ